jgi:hypothetical protein
MLLLHTLLLCKQLSGIELDKHGAVSFEFLYRHGKPKVVEKEELELEIVEFG